MRSILSRLSTLVVVALVALLSFTATAMAAGTADPAGDGSGWFELAKPVFEALKAGNYPAGAALALVLVVGLVSKYGAKRWSVLGTGAGKALLTLVGAFAGALGSAFLVTGPGAVLVPGLYWTAFGVALAAAGGYSLVKTLLGPYVGKLPAWAQPFAKALLWFFESKAKPSDPVADAAAAGDAAVKETPATGVEGILGKPHDVK